VKLLWAPSSPFCRKVVVVASETSILPTLTLVPTDTASQPPSLLEDNPVGKIPTLLLDDGSTLFDSPVICEYLDSLHLGERLFPTGADRWSALRQQALADALVDAAVLVRVERRRPEAERSRAQLERQTGKMKRALIRMSAERATFAVSPTIGSISIAVALAYLDFRFPELVWREDAALMSWYDVFSERASMRASAFRENDP
jgi:glutathione S-transferase